MIGPEDTLLSLQDLLLKLPCGVQLPLCLEGRGQVVPRSNLEPLLPLNPPERIAPMPASAKILRSMRLWYPSLL